MPWITKLVTTIVLLIDTLVAPLGIVADPPGATSALLLRGTVVTMDDEFTVIPDGRVLVRGGMIAAVWSGTRPPRGVVTAGATIVDIGPDALIFPGLINLHDHPSFGMLPAFPQPSTHIQRALGRPLGTEPYANDQQWRADPSPEYLRVVKSPEAIISSSLGLYSEAVKYAEVQSLLGGETSLQGAGVNQPSDFLLARNLDNGAFGRDRIETRVASVQDPAFAEQATSLRIRMQVGLVDAWIVHLAQGVRDGERRRGDTVSSRAELDRIAELGLLNDTTVVLHGTGLERSDFRTMRAARTAHLSGLGGDGLGAKLVWSPFDNLLFYGASARVTDALAEGVTVALGSDFGPVGSRNLLGELKAADVVLHHPDHPAGDPAEIGLNGVALDRTLVAMVTRNAARAVRWNEVGSVERGKVADLLVLRPPAGTPTAGATASPYRSLIDATERDVQLVLVGGEPLVGDPNLMERLKPGDYELVSDHDHHVTKAVDVTDPAVPEGTQTLAQITSSLATALASLGGDNPAPGPASPTRTWSHLKASVDGGAWSSASDRDFVRGYLLPRFGMRGLVNLEAITLSPLLTEDDTFLFDVLGGVPPLDPPFGVYPANENNVLPAGNPFAPAAFRHRWWADAG